jgi:HEAT repeat protein
LLTLRDLEPPRPNQRRGSSSTADTFVTGAVPTSLRSVLSLRPVPGGCRGTIIYGMSWKSNGMRLKCRGKATELIKVLAHEQSESVQVKAVEALGEVGDQRAIEPLKAWLDQTGAAENRKVAIQSIGKIGGPAAADVLLDLFASLSDNGTRSAVAVALGHMRDPRAIASLKSWLDFKSHPDDRDIAIRSIGQIGGPAAVDVLLKSFADPPGSHTRRVLAVELACTGDPRADTQLFEFFKKAPGSLPEIVSALGDRDDRRATPFLCKLLSERLAAQDKSTSDIADTLGRLGDNRAVPILCEMLELAYAAITADDWGWGQKEFMHAVEALERIGDPSALATLRRIRTKPPTKEQLKWAKAYEGDFPDGYALGVWKKKCHEALRRAKSTLRRQQISRIIKKPLGSKINTEI